MILSTPSACERGHLAAQVVDRGAEADGRAGGGDLGGVRRGGAEDRHLLAADLEHEVVEGEGGEQVVGGDVDAAGDDREVGGLDELGQRLGAEVELVVAVDHGVEADAVQHLGLGLAGIGGEEERALEGVAGLEHEDGLALGGHLVAQAFTAVTRRAAPPKHSPAVSSSAEQVELEGVDRLDAAVEVVEVRHVQGERLRGGGEERERGRSEEGLGGAAWTDLLGARTGCAPA